MNGKQWKKKNCGQSRSSSQRGEGAKRMCEEMRKDVVKGRGGKNGADRGNRGRSYWRRGLYKNSSEGGVGSESREVGTGRGGRSGNGRGVKGSEKDL